MNIPVKWKTLVHDSFENPEDFYEYVLGELVGIVPGFLGIRTLGIIKRDNIFCRIPLNRLIIEK